MIGFALCSDRLDYCATKRTWRNQEMRRWDRQLQEHSLWEQGVGKRAGRQAGRQATHIHKRGANLHTYIHTHREDREDREGEEDGWSATFSPPSLRLCFCCLLSLYFLQGGPLDRRRQRYLFCKPAKDTYTLAYKQRERETQRERQRERRKKAVHPYPFVRIGRNEVIARDGDDDIGPPFLLVSTAPFLPCPSHIPSHLILSHPICQFYHEKRYLQIGFFFRLQKVQGLFFDSRKGRGQGTDRIRDRTTRKGLIFGQITTCTPHTGERRVRGERGERGEREGWKKGIIYAKYFFSFNGYGMESTWWK